MIKIIKKYYGKNGRLKNVDKFRKEEPIFRFKRSKDKKLFPCCDFHGTCINYLCRKHYYQEEKRLNWKLPVCSKVEW